MQMNISSAANGRDDTLNNSVKFIEVQSYNSLMLSQFPDLLVYTLNV